ncbi:MAG: FecR domain-containing protein [Clostridia bacterium]|nr:FecR domain-containing protein [Clostridia bacterium]
MRLKKCLCMFLSLMLLCSISFAADKAEGKTIRLESFTGKLSIISGTGKEQPANEKMRLFDGYTVITGANSNAYLSLDNAKTIKLDQNTKINILKKDKVNEIQVVSGSIFFSVTEKLKDDESLNVVTSTMSMGIRGTTGMVSVNKSGSRGQLYSGKVVVRDNKGTEKEVIAGEEVKSTMVKDEVANEQKVDIEVVKLSTVGEDIPSFTLNEINNNEEVKAQVEEAKVFEVEKFVEAEIVNKEKEEVKIVEEQKVIEEVKVEAETQKVENKIEETVENIEAPAAEVVYKKISKVYDDLGNLKLKNAEGQVYIFEIDEENGVANLKETTDFSGSLDIKDVNVNGEGAYKIVP